MSVLVSAAAPPSLPSDWRTAERLRRWCTQAMVREDTEPKPDDTRRLIAAARRADRLALIETLGEGVVTWRAWFGAKLLALAGRAAADEALRRPEPPANPAS